MAEQLPPNPGNFDPTADPVEPPDPGHPEASVEWFLDRHPEFAQEGANPAPAVEPEPGSPEWFTRRHPEFQNVLDDAAEAAPSATGASKDTDPEAAPAAKPAPTGPKTGEAAAKAVAEAAATVEAEPRPKLRPTPVLERPYNVIEAKEPPTDAEIDKIEDLLTKMILAGTHRHDISDQEAKPVRPPRGAGPDWKPPVQPKPVDAYWNGEKGKQGKLIELAQQVNDMRARHPETFARLFSAKFKELSDHVGTARDGGSGASANVDKAQHSLDAARAKQSEFRRAARGIQHEIVRPGEKRKSNETIAHYGPDPKDYRYKFTPLKYKYLKDASDWILDHRPGALRGFIDGWIEVPLPESYQRRYRNFYTEVGAPIVARETLAAGSRLEVAKHERLLERAQYGLGMAEMRVESFADIINTADEIADLPVKELVARYGEPATTDWDMQQHIGENMLRYLDGQEFDESFDETSFRSLNTLHDTLNAADAALNEKSGKKLDPLARRQLVDFRSATMQRYVALRARYEQMMRLNPEAASRYGTDGVIRPDGEEVGLYIDGTYAKYNALLGRPEGYYADGTPDDAGARVIRLEAAEVTAPAELAALRRTQRESFMNWFNSQEDDQLASENIAYSQKLAERLEQSYRDDNDASGLAEAGRLRYWIARMQSTSEGMNDGNELYPSGEVHVHDARVYVAEDNDWVEGAWVFYADGSKDLIALDDNDRTYIDRRFNADGTERS